MTTQDNKYHVALIARDYPSRARLAVALVNEGFHVDLADDGIAAMPLIIEERPDLVLIDSDIARVNGYGVCSITCSNRLVGHAPVVLFTESDGIFDHAWARVMGASHSLTNPVDPSELIEIMLELLTCPAVAHDHEIDAQVVGLD